MYGTDVRIKKKKLVLYVCNIFLTCLVSKVLTCFGFTECK